VISVTARKERGGYYCTCTQVLISITYQARKGDRYRICFVPGKVERKWKGVKFRAKKASSFLTQA